MLLNEVTDYQLTDIEEIHKWIQSIGVKNCYIDPESLIVNVYESVDLSWKHFNFKLPVKFGTVNGDFKINPGTNLRILKGCPDVVNGSFIVAGNKSCNDAVGGPSIVRGNADYSNCSFFKFDGFPKEIYGNLDLHDTLIKSIAGIHKHIKLVDGVINLGANGSKIRDGLMGLLLIRKLKRVSIMQKLHPPSSGIRIDDAINIVNKHLAGDRMLTECQIELQDAGLAQYAKL